MSQNQPRSNPSPSVTPVFLVSIHPYVSLVPGPVAPVSSHGCSDSVDDPDTEPCDIDSSSRKTLHRKSSFYIHCNNIPCTPTGNHHVHTRYLSRSILFNTYKHQSVRCIKNLTIIMDPFRFIGCFHTRVFTYHSHPTIKINMIMISFEYSLPPFCYFVTYFPIKIYKD